MIGSAFSLQLPLANVISDGFFHNASFIVTLSFIGSNTVSAMFAAVVARTSVSPTHSFNRPKGMLVYMACGLLIQAPIAATAGLWLQSVFWNNSFSWFKWIAWWSGNSLGITCFGPISLFLLEKCAQAFQVKKKDRSRKSGFLEASTGVKQRAVRCLVNSDSSELSGAK